MQEAEHLESLPHAAVVRENSASSRAFCEGGKESYAFCLMGEEDGEVLGAVSHFSLYARELIIKFENLKL